MSPVLRILLSLSLIAARGQSFIQKPLITNLIIPLQDLEGKPLNREDEIGDTFTVATGNDDAFDFNIQHEPLHKGCAVSIRNDLKEPKQPLFIKPGTEEFFPYDHNGVIIVDEGGPIELVCTQGFANTFLSNSVVAFCVEGLHFKIATSETLFELGSVVCNSWNVVTPKDTGTKCNTDDTFVDVGFVLDTKRFASVYQVCFNKEYEVTRYVQHKLLLGAANFQNAPRPSSFDAAGFFEEDLDAVYPKASQVLIISEILGYNASKFFYDNFFLVRGHLAAKADFVYGSQQRATFLYINTAPQWQAFNSVNWLYVENGLRKWVDTRKRELHCWTGVYDVTTLPNKFEVGTHLYLYQDMQKFRRHGPVPKLYFKIAIDPLSKRGVVLVGVNNPHLSLDKIMEDYILCSDVADFITYIGWKRQEIKYGFMYACEVNEFRKVVTDLPPFDVDGILI